MTFSLNQTDLNPLILIVDDNEPDFLALQRVLKKIGAANRLKHCPGGQEALDYLRVADEKPGIILLDLNMPGLDGREVLKFLKSDPELHSIPVIVFTTSDSEQDIQSCYDSGVNSYITKPVDLAQLTEVIANVHRYWFSAVKLPVPAAHH